MDLNEILNSLEISSEHGHIISTEDSIILHNSLLILQNENHFRKVFYWGRIFGLDNDYNIAYGYKKDALLDRIYFYSTKCIDWCLLPLPSENAKSITPHCMTRFQGDPALVVNVLVGNQLKRLKEEDRLSATVHLINFDAAVVPRGGLFKRPDGVNVENLTFEGLSQLEARELDNFLHYRNPTRKWNVNLLTRKDYNYAMDFLDPLSCDIPENCWIHNLTDDEQIVTLKSTYWPGMFFYHYLKTNKYGFIYYGNGKKCLDVIFDLN